MREGQRERERESFLVISSPFSSKEPKEGGKKKKKKKKKEKIIISTKRYSDVTRAHFGQTRKFLLSVGFNILTRGLLLEVYIVRLHTVQSITWWSMSSSIKNLEGIGG